MRFFTLLALLAVLSAGCATKTAGPRTDGAVARAQQAAAQTLHALLPKEHAMTLPESELSWYDAQNFLVEGKGWTDTEKFYERLPARAQSTVPPAVWNLSKNTAGIAVRFATDSTTIAAEWDGGGAMNHMAATGVSGLDLYRRVATPVGRNNWEYVGTGRPKETRTLATLKSGLPGELTEYLLFLPLYQNLTDLKVGIDPTARIAVPDPRPTRPIVFYGTSITQGGCASRTGMCHPAIIGRWLEHEVINLGFSGAGKMEPELADLLCELDPCLYVLDCLPNMTDEMVAERVVPFVLKLRECRPDTPILLTEHLLHPPWQDRNALLFKAAEELSAKGVKSLYYLTSDHLLSGMENGTVDGVHPTDLGYFRMAEGFTPVIEMILDRHGS